MTTKKIEKKEPVKNSTFICTWPKELHKAIKAHAAIRNETINNWVLNCILEQLGRESNYIK